MEPLRRPDPPDEKCAFCRIIRGETTCHRVFEDGLSLAFLDHRPLLRGHCLLIPKEHYERLEDLPNDRIGPFFKNVQLLARAVEKALNAEGSFVAINTRVSQSIPHLHVHIAPRWRNDGLFSKILVWRRSPYKDRSSIVEARDSIQSTIKRISAETEIHRS
ncbi:MAG TPA: HIT family protein [Nitrospiria bacterium]|jgi:histidine triad (HIT) family protein|nr:HIT family protein [Nitrospiria bacterium]